MRVCIVGGGAFGLSTSIELSNRGHAVTVFDRYPIPAFDASSSDISRIIRMDYGGFDFYFLLFYFYFFLFNFILLIKLFEKKRMSSSQVLLQKQ